MTTTDLSHWLALVRAPGLGNAGLTRLLEQFATPAAIFAAGEDALRTQGLSDKTRDYLRAPDWGRIEEDLAWAEQRHNHIIVKSSPSCPRLLQQIPDAPVLLFVSGDPEVLGLAQIAIVGSRNPTPPGRETSHEFARHLAGFGFAITSGLALGVDGAAHHGALDAGGTSIAVCGTGLDRVYPPQHRRLAGEIAASGALVSEFPPGTPPRRENFPRRNRLISGLALGTLVVEAAQRSGSLITARLAAEQGREVFAIPGSIHNPVARGCHKLIREGAKLVESATDILEELQPLAGALLTAGSPPARQAGTAAPTLDPDYARLLEALGYEPSPIDALVGRTGLTPEEVSSMLLILELEGVVESAPGGTFSRVIERT